MMSLTEVSMIEVIRKQYRYKLKAYVGIFSSLVTIQLLALLFSLSGTGSSGFGTAGLDMNIQYFSADIVIVFTILWGFMTAFLLTTTAYREDDFAFITNRLSSNLSTIIFLLTASVIGGITAIFSSFLLKVVVFYFISNDEVINTGWVDDPYLFFMGLVATILLIFFFGSVGYLVGMIVQWNALFKFVIPAVFIGFLILIERIQGAFVAEVFYDFYFRESAFFLYVIKLTGTAAMLFAGAILIANRLEVKR